MKRDIWLKQRETESLPLEKLRDILSQIYPEETVEELMNNLWKNTSRRKENDYEG